MLVDVSAGPDPKNEHYESIVLDVVDHPVAADSDATPTRRSRQNDRAGRPRVLSQFAYRLEYPPTGEDVNSSNLLVGRRSPLDAVAQALRG